jgi:hypothetical protein
MVLPYPLSAAWLTEVGESALDALSFVPVVVTLITFAALVRAWYRRTLGRRRDRYSRLARLGTNAQLSFFTSVLGEPPAIKQTLQATIRRYVPHDEYVTTPGWEIASTETDELDELEDEDEGQDGDGYVWVNVPTTYIECFFIDRDYFVQALCNEDETVLAFSVTTRSRRFRPTFSGHESLGRRERRAYKKMTGRAWRDFFHLHLGRTTFGDLGVEGWSPSHRVIVGARWGSYSEAYYFGNPGHYQTFVFSAGGRSITRRSVRYPTSRRRPGPASGSVGSYTTTRPIARLARTSADYSNASGERPPLRPTAFSVRILR